MDTQRLTEIIGALKLDRDATKTSLDAVAANIASLDAQRLLLINEEADLSKQLKQIKAVIDYLKELRDSVAPETPA